MIPLYSTAQIREADEYALKHYGIPGSILMENAARSVFELVESNFADQVSVKTVGIVCGKGNNGGDGFALARNFLINDYYVVVVALADEKTLKGDALFNYNILLKMASSNKNISIVQYKNSKSLLCLEDCEIIIDALLGTGTKGALNEEYTQIISNLNEISAIKIAVDIPTGLDCDTATGDIIFEADMTVSLSELKTGLFYGKGYLNSGKIVKGSIGMGSEYYEKLEVDRYLIEPEDVFNYLPPKDLAAHKYSSGKVLVIAGSGKYSGAAFLTSNAVMKSGAGACTLTFPKSIKNIALQSLTVPTVNTYEDFGNEYLSVKSMKDLEEWLKWADCIAIGPGLGREEDTFIAVREIINKYKNKPFIIDADALYALGNKVYKGINLSGKVLTPHQKEFADLLGITLNELQKDLISYGSGFAKENDCYLVLKGAPTIIFNPEGEAIINSTGNPGMAKFGTGDVLTGFLAGMGAQSKSVEQAVIISVYLHSLAADLLIKEKTVFGMTSLDILEKLPFAIKFIYDTFTSDT